MIWERGTGRSGDIKAIHPTSNKVNYKGRENGGMLSFTDHKGVSHISQAVADDAFSKVHIGQGLVVSIGAGDDVAVRSLIVSSGHDSDVHPRASSVPPNPPPSISRCGTSVSVSRSSSFSCSSRKSRTSLARMLRDSTLALLSANSWPW